VAIPRKKTIRFRQSLFWDADPKTIDPKRHARYIIERVLDLGRDPEVRWIFRFYAPHIIKKVIRQRRAALDPKSKALWTLLYR